MASGLEFLQFLFYFWFFCKTPLVTDVIQLSRSHMGAAERL